MLNSLPVVGDVVEELAATITSTVPGLGWHAPAMKKPLTHCSLSTMFVRTVPARLILVPFMIVGSAWIRMSKPLVESEP